MLENLKLIGLNIQEYVVDFLLFVILGFFTNFVIYLIYNPLHDFLPSIGLSRDYDIFPISISALKIAAWIVVFLFVRWLMKNRITTLLSNIFKNGYDFDSEKTGKKLTEKKLMKEWVIQGNVAISKGSLLISNSNSGCLIKPRYIFSRIWGDFNATMVIAFPNQKFNCFEKILGIVFRAQNFDDYFLLEVCLQQGRLITRPHVRIGGNFDAPDKNPDFDSYELKSQENEDIKLELEVKGQKATLYINDDKKNPLIWILPDYVEPRLIQHTSGEAKANSKTAITRIYFRDSAGMFGFRNYPNELALIKSLNIC